ncbi:MAG: LodA/GoxA family CTQ-dependent oxidase, partial [Chloroflexi bacterium]|nr:LodA/GoxA family CTQ-dependent oxidase [Chloroflexota bacterium]
MASHYEIHPRIGVARLGNSPTDFYLSPETVGGLPIKCDESGNSIVENGSVKFVKKFKDSVGRIKRQAAKFRIFERTENGTTLVELPNDTIEKIVWTVHIANKKPIWHTFSELLGDLEFPNNSYEDQHVTLNNSGITDETDRKKLIIDPGPRSIERPGDTVPISRYNIPGEYQYGSFPPLGSGGAQIDSLGELKMDDEGNLVVLGGYGNVTGSAEITSFRGAGGYWDDISDGFVMATIHLK